MNSSAIYYIDIVKGLITTELSKVQAILHRTRDPFVIQTCEKLDVVLRGYLQEKIEDHNDLDALRHKMDTISEGIRLLTETIGDDSSAWVRPLINQCYKLCDISLERRKILIIQNRSTVDFEVYVDFPILRDLDIEQDVSIDIFRIPYETRFDPASISLIGHEVGHVLLKTKFSDDVFDTHAYEILLSQFFERSEDEGQLTIEVYYHIPRVANHIIEYLCDEIGRALFPVSFDFSLLKLLSHRKDKGSSTHPPLWIRLDDCYKHLLEGIISAQPHQRLVRSLNALTDYFKLQWDKNGRTFKPKKSDEPEIEEIDRLTKAGAETLVGILKLSAVKLPEDIKTFWDVIVSEYDKLRPPFESVHSADTALVHPIQAQIVATVYFYGKDYVNSNELFKGSKHDNKDDLVREKLVSHLIYAISLHDFVKDVRTKFDPVALGAASLWSLRNRVDQTPFVVVPTIDPERQYGINAVDLRLGTHFIISKLTQHTHVTTQPGRDNADVERFYDRHYVDVADSFTIHPQSFVLASTLEYVSLPGDFYALVVGRSTWGRLGLNIATATAIGPGFRGCITLELRNLSETPLTLKVGTRVCQICLVKVPVDKVAGGYFVSANKYICPTTAEIPKIMEDPDWELFTKFQGPHHLQK